MARENVGDQFTHEATAIAVRERDEAVVVHADKPASMTGRS
jgi:hypothetical protein